MDNILLMGDIHGNWKLIRDLYKSKPDTFNNRYKENILILLGDAGLNYYFNHRDEEVKMKLGKYPFTYFVIRGNHEQRPSICMEKYPDKWQIETYFNGLVYVEKKYPYIKYASDEVAVYEIPWYTNYFFVGGVEEEKEIAAKTLIVPGAYSPDKEYRLKNGWSYFPEEQLTEKERLAGLELIKFHNYKFDFILAHTCPRIFEPFIQDLFLSSTCQSKIDKTMENYLNLIVEQCKYERFYFGHYHDNRNIIPYRATMLFHHAILFGDYFI